MDEQPTHGVHPAEDLPAAGSGDRDDAASGDQQQADATSQALAAEAQEIRRLIDAGAGSPEELRALAARLREHRAREESLWRENVKPALVKENKGRLRGHVTAPKEPKVTSSPSLATVGLSVLALVAVVVIAASTTVLVLIVPLIVLLVWAWRHGRDTMR